MLDVKVGQIDENDVVVLLSNSFDSRLVPPFDELFREINSLHRHVIFDMAKVSFLDSMGMGMLLAFNSFVPDSMSKISLVHCQKQIRDNLLKCRFDRKFEIQ